MVEKKRWKFCGSKAQKTTVHQRVGERHKRRLRETYRENPTSLRYYERFA